MKHCFHFFYGLILFSALMAHAEPKKIWVYTSAYKEYASELEKAFEKKHPEVDVQIFQAGSEKLRTKVEAELFAKRPVADVLMVSDPLWCQDMEKRGLVAPRGQHNRSALENSYYSVMVLIIHNQMPKEKRPTQFADLAKPEFKSLIQMGNPLESGSTFTAVSLLSKKYGWDFFKKLKENELASNGGNSTVIQKVETGEKKIGVVLLENALAAKKRSSPIDIIYPEDGSIVIPSVQVILKSSQQKELALQFTDFVLSIEGQEILRKGYMYSVRKDVKAPEGALDFVELSKKAQNPSMQEMAEISAKAKLIKKNFSEIVLE